MSMGQRTNLSPRLELNQWPPKHRAGALTTELQNLMESKVIKLSLMTSTTQFNDLSS